MQATAVKNSKIRPSQIIDFTSSSKLINWRQW